LLATPAAAAQRLTSRPYRALAISAGIAVASVWIGLAFAYAVSRVPPSFAILSVATGAYIVARIAGARGRQRRAMSTSQDTTSTDQGS
jgi:zinc/manganese transport system permease protein